MISLLAQGKSEEVGRVESWKFSDLIFNLKLSAFSEHWHNLKMLQSKIFLHSFNMPRATTDRFSRAHQPSAKAKSAPKSSDDSSTVRNPLFNTERFGQHILKNPAVAQG